MDEQEFRDWIEVKINVYARGRARSFSEGEIWWCAMGRNVGVEINGKSKEFARPVVVLRKLNKFSFMAIPLTSQVHIGSWYVCFKFRGLVERAVLAQARVVSTARLYRRVGRADETDLSRIREGFHNLFCK